MLKNGGEYYNYLVILKKLYLTVSTLHIYVIYKTFQYPKGERTTPKMQRKITPKSYCNILAIKTKNPSTSHVILLKQSVYASCHFFSHE